MLSLDFQQSTAEACAPISANSINAIHGYHASSLHQQTERYSSVIYLTGAIIPLICILLKGKNTNEMQSMAISSLNKGLSLLQDIAVGFNLARTTLQQLHRVIRAVNRAISPQRADRINLSRRSSERPEGNSIVTGHREQQQQPQQPQQPQQMLSHLPPSLGLHNDNNEERVLNGGEELRLLTDNLGSIANPASIGTSEYVDMLWLDVDHLADWQMLFPAA